MLRALWKIYVYLISTLVNKSLYHYVRHEYINTVKRIQVLYVNLYTVTILNYGCDECYVFTVLGKCSTCLSNIEEL